MSILFAHCSGKALEVKPQSKRRPGASRGSVADQRRRRVPPLGLPDPRREFRRRRVLPDSDPDRRADPGDRIAIQMVTGGRRWDSLTADTDAVTLGRRSPGAATLRLSHTPAVSASKVLALIGPVGGTSTWAGPNHSPTASASSPPNVVSSCLTISACFFSLRVTLAANTAAEATMIARGT